MRGVAHYQVRIYVYAYSADEYSMMMNKISVLLLNNMKDSLQSNADTCTFFLLSCIFPSICTPHTVFLNQVLCARTLISNAD